MKKFFLKFTIFFAIVFGYLIGVIYLSPVDQEIFIAAARMKHRLLDETPQPRIIFIGGSSLAFGLDSKLVREKTGYNIVNMGLHGGLGPSFYVNEVKRDLKKGDIVIVILEYAFYSGLFFGGRTTLVELSIFYPRSILFYSKENMDAYFENLPITFQRRLRGLTAKPKKKDEYNYFASGFNEVGDYVRHLTVKPRVEISGQVVPEKIDRRVVALLSDFRRYCDRRGVKVYITFPPILPPEGRDRQPFLDNMGKLYGAIKSEIPIQVFGRPEDFLYPQDYFFDTVYHLNARGRQVRTRDLVEKMKEVVPPLIGKK